MSTENQTEKLSEAQKSIVDTLQENIERMYEFGDQRAYILPGSKNLPGEEIPNQKTGPATVIPPAAQAPGLADPTPFESRKPLTPLEKAANIFLSRNHDKIESIAAVEAEKSRVIGEFKALEQQLSGFKYKLRIREKIRNLLTTDIVDTFYENVVNGDKAPTQLCSDPFFQTAIALRQPAPLGEKQTIGDRILKRIDDEHAALKKQYADHVRANEPLLKERGLI